MSVLHEMIRKPQFTPYRNVMHIILNKSDKCTYNFLFQSKEHLIQIEQLT